MSLRSVPAGWLAVAAGAVVLGLAGTWVSIGLGRPGVSLFHLLVGWTLAASGLVAWRAMPSSRVGLLLALAGAALFLGDFAACLDLSPLTRACLRVPPLAAASGALAWLWTGFLAHAILAFPSGRAGGWSLRVAVAMGYLAAMTPGLWTADLGALALTTALLLVVVITWRTAPRRTRATRGPAVVAATLMAGTCAAAELTARLRAMLPPADPVLGSLALTLRSVTPTGVLPFTSAVVGVVLAAAIVERAGTSARAADRVVELDGLPPGAWAADAADPVEAARLAAAIDHVRRSREANAALQAASQSQLDAVLASRRRLVDAAVDERRDLEQRLHDGAEQRLRELAAALVVAEETHRQAPSPGAPRADAGVPDIAELLARAIDQLAETRREVHELAHGLHPRILDEQGLAGALTDLCARSPIPATFSTDGATPTLPRAVTATAWFLVNEALTNTLKHARANRVDIRLESVLSAIRVTVIDDGAGGAAIRPGGGLDGLRERLDALGGTLRVDSPPGQGTCLIATIPGDEAR